MEAVPGVPLTPSPKLNPEVLIVLFVPTSAPFAKVPFPDNVRSCPPTVPEIVRALDAAVVSAS